MLILDRERRKRRGKGQADAQVSFEAAKESPDWLFTIDVNELLIVYTETSSPASTWPTGFKLEFIHFLIA